MKELIKKYKILILGIIIILLCGIFALSKINNSNSLKNNNMISNPIEDKEKINNIKFKNKFVSETEENSYIGFISKNEIILSLNGESVRYRISDF